MKIDVPGATARQLSGLRQPRRTLGAEYFSLGAGTDIAPLLVGLEDDICQAPHWGYVIERAARGDLQPTGRADNCAGGDVFYWPAGHSVRVEDDAEVILFSPPAQHLAVIDHMKEQLARA